MTPSLSDEQRKQIEREVNKDYPFVNDGDPDTIIAIGAARSAYINCAMKYTAVCQQKDEELSRLRMQSLNMKIALQQIEKYECGSDAGNFRIISIKSIATEGLKPIIP